MVSGGGSGGDGATAAAAALLIPTLPCTIYIQTFAPATQGTQNMFFMPHRQIDIKSETHPTANRQARMYICCSNIICTIE